IHRDLRTPRDGVLGPLRRGRPRRSDRTPGASVLLGHAGASGVQVASARAGAALRAFRRRVRRVRAGAHSGCSPPRHRLNLADLTFVVLTKDEVRHIAGCLQSLPQGAHALVYDAESRDGTTGVAASVGAEVVVRPWV